MYAPQIVKAEINKKCTISWHGDNRSLWMCRLTCIVAGIPVHVYRTHSSIRILFQFKHVSQNVVQCLLFNKKKI